MFDQNLTTLTQEHFIQWVSPFRWDAFYTLCFDYDVTREEAETCVEKFYRRLHAVLYPRVGRHSLKFNAVTSFERTAAGRLHVHSALGDEQLSDPVQAKKLGYNCWIVGRKEFHRQRHSLKRRGGNPREMRFFVPNAVPKCTHAKGEPCSSSSKKCWYKPIYDAEGLFDYISKDSRFADTTNWLSPKNTHLNIRDY